MTSLQTLYLKSGSFIMPRHGKNPFYQERDRLRQINEAIDYMESMLPTTSDAVKALLIRNIDQSKKQAQTILNQMILDGYTGENHGRS
jgi:hypothetical protein